MSLYDIELVQVTLEINQVLVTLSWSGGRGGCRTGRPGTRGEGGLSGATDTVLTVLVYLTGEEEIALVLVVSEVLTLS